MRELVAMFTQEESRDELGIAAIRDAFSNRLFPGTSVIQTRARYLLFVPWIFREGGRRGLSGSALRDWGETRERRLITALRQGGDDRGLVGRVAGRGVKTLPSTIYWGGLQTYGIARHPGGLDQALRSSSGVSRDEADEPEDRRATIWHPTLPEFPPGFLRFERATFELSGDEATWLAERIEETVPDSLMGYLLLHRLEPLSDSTAPWEDPAAQRLPDPLNAVVEHGRVFSLAIHGANLLYNLLLARQAEEVGFPADDWPGYYEGLLDQWWREVAQDPGFGKWDRRAFWEVAGDSYGRVAPPTVRFVNSWFQGIEDGSAAKAASNPVLAVLISGREKQLKGTKSRFLNDRLLANWRGDSGVGRHIYRWDTARTQLLDIFAGLGHAGA